MPARRAASIVPFPATTTPCPSMTMDRPAPNRRRLDSIPLAFRSSWARRFAGSVCKSSIATFSTFTLFFPCISGEPDEEPDRPDRHEGTTITISRSAPARAG
jgi:hypothetical protein